MCITSDHRETASLDDTLSVFDDHSVVTIGADAVHVDLVCAARLGAFVIEENLTLCAILDRGDVAGIFADVVLSDLAFLAILARVVHDDLRLRAAGAFHADVVDGDLARRAIYAVAVDHDLRVIALKVGGTLGADPVDQDFVRTTVERIRGTSAPQNERYERGQQRARRYNEAKNFGHNGS